MLLELQSYQIGYCRYPDYHQIWELLYSQNISRENIIMNYENFSFKGFVLHWMVIL